MKLIGTIKSIINENRVADVVQEMGLYDAIRYFGGYDNLMKRMGDYVLSNEDMVDFIKKTVKHLSDKYNDDGVSVWDLDMSPITIGQPDEELQQIEYFSSNGFISINVYGGEYYQDNIASFTEQYEDLNDSTLDEVFLFMVDALENNK
jgi:beta-xylosidase